MAMYREVVERRKESVIFAFFFILSFIIVISDIFDKMIVGSNNSNRWLKIIFLLTMIIIAFMIIRKARVRYKYSIMGDHLIIHKINGKEETIAENIHFENIKFIGRDNKLKNNYNIMSSKKYLCSLIQGNKYCCIYESGSEIRKFYFEPSDKLIKKIKCNNIVI